mmetsp:Transcript_62715/g.183890  ORF Transcript_62715/g.183890 Transcript_62715/m.183890 type:complete len:220 (+) Transcript_62715:192-851(+)
MLCTSGGSGWSFTCTAQARKKPSRKYGPTDQKPGPASGARTAAIWMSMEPSPAVSSSTTSARPGPKTGTRSAAAARPYERCISATSRCEKVSSLNCTTTRPGTPGTAPGATAPTPGAMPRSCCIAESVSGLRGTMKSTGSLAGAPPRSALHLLPSRSSTPDVSLQTQPLSGAAPALPPPLRQTAMCSTLRRFLTPPTTARSLEALAVGWKSARRRLRVR